jgi:hypothetical protein
MIVPPVIPPQAPLQQLLHGPVAIEPWAVRFADGDLAYSMSAVGEAGRIADKHLSVTLGWRPGIRLDIAATDAGLLVVRPSADGAARIATSGYFPGSPNRQRRRVSLFVGDRVLFSKIGCATRC